MTLAEALASIGATQRTIVLANAQTVASDMTVPSTVDFLFASAGVVTISAGKTLTLPKPQESWPQRQLFAGSGTLAFSRRGDFYPEWVGAVGDGVTVDTTALQKAIDIAATVRGRVVLTQRYKTGLLTWKAGAELVGFHATEAGTAGPGLIGTTAQDVLRLETAVGILDGFRVSGFNIVGGLNGVHIPVTTGSNGYVNIHICDMTIINCENEGLFNEGYTERSSLRRNVIAGCDHAHYVSVASAGTPDWDKWTCEDNYFHNNSQHNVRIDAPVSNQCSFINEKYKTAQKDCFVANGGIINWTIINPNTEANGQEQAGAVALTTGTITSGTPDLVVASATNIAIGNTLTVKGAGVSGADLISVVTNVVGTAVTLTNNAGTSVTAQEVTNAKYSDFVFKATLGTPSGIKFEGGTIGSALGRYAIDMTGGGGATTVVGSLIVEATTCYRPIYDPDGGLYLLGGSGAVRQHTSGGTSDVFGGFLAAIRGTVTDRSLLASPGGKNIVLALLDSLLTGLGTYGSVDVYKFNSARTLLARLYGDTGHLGVVGKLIPVHATNPAGIYYGTAAPVAGTYIRGDIVFNQDAAVGQPHGWMCTVSGTPGTWVALANL